MKTSFSIYPEHCNYLPLKDSLMVHGGILLKEADRIAAIEVKEFLRLTRLKGLTVGVNNCQFHKACKLGETLTLSSFISSVNKSRINVWVTITDHDRDWETL